MEQVLDGEVGEFQSEFSDYTRLSPTHRELDLVVSLRFEIEHNVNSSVFLVGHRLYVDGLGIEMTCLGYFTIGTHEVVLGEKLTGLHAKFTADHLFIQAVVTVYDNIIDTRLRTFDHSHLKVDGIAFDVSFDGNELIEEIALIEVSIGDRVFVFRDTFLEQFLIIDIAALDSENVVEKLSGINGVTDPGDVIDVIFPAFFKRDIHIDGLVVERHDGIGKNLGIAITFFVIFLYDALEVVLEIGLDKFFLTEKIEELAFLVGLFHCALQSIVAHDLITVNVYFVNLHFCILIDVNVDDHFVWRRVVFLKSYIDGSVSETFIGEIFLYDRLGAVDDVLGYLVALVELQAFFEVIALAFLHSEIADIRNAGLSAEVNGEPCLVAGSLIDNYPDLAEKALSPEAFAGRCQFGARNINSLPYFQTGVSQNDVGLEIVGTRHFDTCNLIGSGQSGKDHTGITDGIS